MPLQLVRAREALTAEQPVADEGSLPCVPAEMRLEVGGLAVDLPAAADVTDVLLPLSRTASSSGGVLAVGTPASSAAPCRGHGRGLEGGREESSRQA